MMVSVKRELLRKIDENDDSYYLWAISYFMRFNRFYDFQSVLISETISVQSFHHIQTQITNYQEMMLTDKKKTKVWAKRMQLGVSAYKELLETLKMMEKSQDEAVRESADALISHVFYVIEYREMLLSLLSNFDEVKFSLSYLAELVESTQLFLKMLENHSKKHSEIIVQKKQKKTRRKKKKALLVEEPINTHDELNEQWNNIITELSEAIQQKVPILDVTPFDGASEMSFEEQKVEAMYKIREALVANKPLETVGLLRAARELWPEGDSFGAVGLDSDSELNVLKEIHFSGLQRIPSVKNVEVEESDDEEENEEIEAQSSVAEQKLDLNDVYKKYANHKVIYPCSLLFANYQNNKPQTNACLIKLFHRIAWNCKMHGLFFQSTIFLTFQKIFHDPDVNCNPLIKEFSRFAKYIMQKFFFAAQKNEKIFVEFLFWKGSREVYELEEGYGTSNNKGKVWTEEDDEELKYLFEENKDIYIEGEDVADIILANLNTRKRSKLQVISALKRLGLIKSKIDLKPEKRKEWQESETVELQHLFEDNKDSTDIMSIILDKLSIKRTRKAVIEKLLELNLITDKKEVRKKSSKKHAGKSRNADSSENEDLFQESEDDDCVFSKDKNSDTSGEEAEINFFKNLDAEKYVSDNSFLHGKEDDCSNGKVLNIDDSNIKIKNKLQAIWEEQEVIQLSNLFHENKESNDIMHVILNSLSKRRSKEAVVEKLLELGLIKSKKEIRKKGKHERQKLLNLDECLKNSANEESESDLEIPIHRKLFGKSNEKKILKRQILSDSDENNDVDKTVNSISHSKIKQSKAWNEEEVILLNQLFIEHKEKDDILSNILCNLSTKRTKKNVVEKMLEIGLIKTKDDLKRKKNSKTDFSKQNTNKVLKKHMSKKSSEMWEESELSELNQLYQSHKNSDNIITGILNGLTLKRNKKDVVEKMLEIGLIKDKKEIRKKRVSKKGKDKQNPDKMKDSDSEGFQNWNSASKAVNNLSSESSDGENLPLISITSNNSLKNYAAFSVSDNSPQHYEMSATEEITSNENSDYKNHTATLNRESHQVNSKEVADVNEWAVCNKRKRLLIDSDSDDNSKFVEKDTEFLDQGSSVPNSIDNLNDKSLFFLKPHKKKICVLEDSDESS